MWKACAFYTFFALSNKKSRRCSWGGAARKKINKKKKVFPGKLKNAFDLAAQYFARFSKVIDV